MFFKTFGRLSLKEKKMSGTVTVEYITTDNMVDNSDSLLSGPLNFRAVKTLPPAFNSSVFQYGAQSLF